ncbi:hypothetical protein L1987_28432 [Smallanthus sonchifolius]|uniref:Uncharacterized protein n=1 Tax=Smallanthus sonchifolius TaxID=185202 RepID=A0ACB9HXQ3_9ASTR|nr:hypothetical protein L1987_28432 [Smallanthus sonchifolius]
MNNKTIICMLFVLAFVISIGFAGRTPTCTSVVGVKNGDSCFGIAQAFQLSSGFFEYINPNLNCNKLFVGEWICVDGI